MTARFRASLSAGLVAATGVALTLALPLAAGAAPSHNVLIASTPEANETLTELPPEFSITTNEDLLALPGSKGFALEIQDAAGAYYGDGCVEVAGPTMSAAAALGEPGDYTVLWQAVSEDGHSVSGSIPFTWAPADDVEPSTGSAAPPVCGEAATPTPTPSATASPTSEPTAEPAPASGIDLATVLWIGGILLAIAIAVAIGIAVAGRRRP
jgi:methionine-rich copper-binding protein CopC